MQIEDKKKTREEKQKKFQEEYHWSKEIDELTKKIDMHKREYFEDCQKRAVNAGLITVCL